MQLSTKANLYLVLIAAIWGATFPLIRNAVAEIDPNLFVFVRFVLAALIMLPIVWRQLNKTTTTLLINSFIFGLLNCVSYSAQTIGLQTISSATSAFITAVYVVLVPFLAPMFKVGKLQTNDIVSSLVCLLGVYVLTGADMELNRGEWWTLLCAISFAFQIAYMQRLSAQIKNYQLLTFYQLLFTVPPVFLFTSGVDYHPLMHIDVVIGLVFCAIFATAMVFLIQTKYQKFTTASKAALIFALEPVFAAILGYLINGETITKNIALGGLLILFSLVIPTLIQLFKKLRQPLQNGMP